MTSELEYTIIRRSRQLRNERREPDAEVRDIMPGGAKVTLETSCGCGRSTYGCTSRICAGRSASRAISTRRARTSPRDLLALGLPKVVAKNAGARPHTAVVFDVSGPLEFMRTVRVDADGLGTVDGSPSLGPAVTLSLDWETYMRLAAGRVRPEAVSEQVKIEGDAKLAKSILDDFSVTP